jgi:hypothetical protein
VTASARTVVDEGALAHVGYARLVRKGAGGRERADRVEAGYTIRSALWRGASPCQGAVAGWAADLPAFSLGARGIACRGSSSNAFLDATADQLAAELRAVHAWDRGRTSLAVGPLVGAALLTERFSTTGSAPARTSLAGIAGVTAAVSVDLADRFYVTGELDGITAFFRQQDGMAEIAMRAASSIRGNLLVGARW